MVRKIYKLALQHILVNIRLCQKMRFIRVQKMSWCIQISNIELSYKKLCERFINLWTMYGHTLLKLSSFFVAILWTNICFHIIFLKKNWIFWHYCYYYVVIWRKKVWIVPRRQFNFSSISRKWTIMGHQSLVVIFL